MITMLRKTLDWNVTCKKFFLILTEGAESVNTYQFQQWLLEQLKHNVP
jgi:hypothetical protein